MTEPLRIGVLGVGRIGAMHVDLLQSQVAGATVTGVFDVNSAAAEAAAAKHNVEQFDSADQLIASEQVDAVAICTSTDTHVEMIVSAATHGKAIFCEKPVSLSLEEVDRAIDAVDAAGVLMHVGFNRRFDASHAAVQEAVASGAVGEVRQLRISSRDPAPPPIAYIEVSGGIFLDMTIHDFDMARFVSGSEVTSVYAVGAVKVDPAIGAAGDLDTIVVVLSHENGAVTTIDNCREAVYGYDQRVEAFGSGGVAASENHLDHYTTVRDGSGLRGATVPYFFLDRYIPSYVKQWENFAQAVAEGGPPSVGPNDGRAPLLMGLAAWRSVKEGRPVSISEVDETLEAPS